MFFNNSINTDILWLILLALTGRDPQTDTLVSVQQGDKISRYDAGVLNLSEYTSATFIAHGDNCSLFGDPCGDGRSYDFGGNGKRLGQFTYDAGGGRWEISLERDILI